MIFKLLDWSIKNPIVVILSVIGLVITGGYAFTHVSIEAYPDPTPAIIDVVAQWPGASAEQVERQVTVPIEVALAGMPGLEATRSQSVFGLASLRNQFRFGKDYWEARQEVLNRLSTVDLPDGVDASISPASVIGEILRYTLLNPVDPATGDPVYSLNDLQALQDFVIEREMRRVPGVAGVSGVGGAVKRYEIQPDPERMRLYGVSLQQLEEALRDSNATGSGDNIVLGEQLGVVRSLGLLGQGQDPQQLVLEIEDPVEAARILRAEEARRCIELRQIVVATVNNVPVRIDQLVDGGPKLLPDGSTAVEDTQLVESGIVVGHETRKGLAGISRRSVDRDGNLMVSDDGTPIWIDEQDVVQAVCLIYKGEKSMPALEALVEKIDELHESGKLLPGVKILPYYNRSGLVERTTHTVHENLVVGMALVTTILLMFLGNVRAAVIAAINIPLALLFAFLILFARGKSANLLSIGAVDFGIIVDSTVIVVESVYRKLSQVNTENMSLRERIMVATSGVQRSLVFATAVMVCALLPLFAMSGPEGQIFGPMADTYAFALGGALVLAVTVSPVLCLLFLGKVRPKSDNWLARSLSWFYVTQLRWALSMRWLVLAGFIAIVAFTGFTAAKMGREFMPELEEGTILVRGTFPVNISFDEVVEQGNRVRGVLQNFGEIEVIPSVIGRPNDAMDPEGYYLLQANLPLINPHDWPQDPSRGRVRTKPELIEDIAMELSESFPGVTWEYSQIIRDNVLEALSGVKADNSVTIFGPDLKMLESLAMQVRDALNSVPGVTNASIYRTLGQSNLEFPVDRQKCALWNVSAADVQAVIQTAVGGHQVTQMIEGEKIFDVTVRWPERLRSDEQAILNLPVAVGNTTVDENRIALTRTPMSGESVGLSPTGTSLDLPSVTGNRFNAAPVSISVPTRRLGDLVTPLNSKGQFDPDGSFLQPGASTIYRDNGQRKIAVKFQVEGRDLASAVAASRQVVDPIIHKPYSQKWGGEFEQMEAAEHRLAQMFGVSMLLITILLYLAFRSILDAGVVLANVVAMGVGGIWALKLTGLYFNISAAVGFISILGVAVMNGLILVSSFNSLRRKGVPLEQALSDGIANRIRPLTITALVAALGLLPAALSTEIGSESQRPLAIVVVGGMITTMLLVNFMPVLYSFYGHRTPPEGASDVAH